MSRQNRVRPDGTIVSVPDRGTLMGNRGCLHDENARIVRTSASKRWIFCQLSYRGNRRRLMQTGRYTELFFLDEVTALSAGHRPCGECNRRLLKDFRACFPLSGCTLAEMDAVLHAERMGEPITIDSYRDLPRGAMFKDSDSKFYLWNPPNLLEWSFAGYHIASSEFKTSVLLTPKSIVTTLAAGYRPQIAGFE
jgi:hypothetical protein